MNEEQVMHAMSIDDAYAVKRVLTRSNLGVTEIVTLDDIGPFVRKKIPTQLANRKVWAALAECESPRLPQIAVTYEMPDEFIVVYDYVPGNSLEGIVSAAGHLSVAEALSIIGELGEAVSDLHHHGIIHCDIAPGNVIIAADGAHLIDFGIARYFGAGTDGLASLHSSSPGAMTGIGSAGVQAGGSSRMGGMRPSSKAPAFGTWGFASPEQHGFAPADQRSDVYSLTCLLGFLLCGVSPDQDEYELRLADDEYVPPALRQVIEKGTAFEPSARYQSCEQFLEALGCGQGSSAQAQSSHNNPVAAPSPQAAIPMGPPTGELQARSFASTLKSIKPSQWVILISMVVLCIAIGIVVGFATGHLDQSNGVVYQQGPSGTEASSSTGASDFDTGSPAGNESGAQSSAENVSLSDMLKLTETGWHADGYGMVYFAFGLQNTDASHGVLSPAVRITGKAEDGSILFTQDEPVMYIQPGETIHYGAMAGDGSSAPATVDFTPVAPSQASLVSGDAADNAVFKVSNVSVLDTAYEGLKFTGEVSLAGGIYPDEGSGSVLVTVVLRDDAGNIVYGDSIDANEPTATSSVPFSISCLDAPDYASYDIYVQVF